jgi:hypothetical protein
VCLDVVYQQIQQLVETYEKDEDKNFEHYINVLLIPLNLIIASV